MHYVYLHCDFPTCESERVPVRQRMERPCLCETVEGVSGCVRALHKCEVKGNQMPREGGREREVL